MPDSRHKKSFVQAYNAQAAVDAHAQVIVAAEITLQTNDRQQLVPLTQAVKKNMGKDPEALLADAGYWVDDSLRDPLFKNILVLVAPDSQRSGAGKAVSTNRRTPSKLSGCATFWPPQTVSGATACEKQPSNRSSDRSKSGVTRAVSDCEAWTWSPVNGNSSARRTICANCICIATRNRNPKRESRKSRVERSSKARQKLPSAATEGPHDVFALHRRIRPSG
jgi:hypothetical protein